MIRVNAPWEVHSPDPPPRGLFVDAPIAIDGQWNPVQQGAGDTLTARAVSIDDVSLKAIGAVVAAAVADALASRK